MNPIRIVQQLRLVKGGKAKLKVLREHEDDLDWKSILLAMYDTRLNYYVSAPKDLTFISQDIPVGQMLYDLQQLSNRTYTGNAAKEIALEGSQQYGEIYRLILEGTLKAGVSTGLLNKAYNGLIPLFLVMKGSSKAKATYPALGSIKYDGVRIIARVYKHEVQLETSHGKALVIKSLEKSLSTLPNGVYDGEIVAGNGKVKDRSNISGLVTKCIRGTANNIKADYTYCIFDVCSTTEWRLRKSEVQFCNRYAFLQSLPTSLPHVLFVQQELISSKEEEQKWFEDLIEKGYEGLILRYAEDPYIWGRSDRLVKRKSVIDGTLTVAGTTMGKEGTKNEGLIGALKCFGYIEGKHVEVDIGSGLSDWDRDQDPDYFIGKQVDMQYNSVTKAENSKWHSLFLCRFKRLTGGA